MGVPEWSQPKSRRPAGRPRIGLSTAAVGHCTDLAALVALGCEVVELCGCNTARWQRVAPLVRSAGVPVGLHCPIPFDGRLRRFDITSADDAERAVAFELVERTLRAAAESAAAYVVVHFPSPYPRPASDSMATPEPGRRDPRRWEFILRCGAQLATAQARSGIPVFVENLSYHPDFGSAQDYRAFFQEYPDLRMCLDVGHAHVSTHGTDVYEFVRSTVDFVGSVHVYNTRRTGEKAGQHAVPLVRYEPDEEWIDLPKLLALLAGGSRPDYLVLEYAAASSTTEGDYAATEWLRELVGELMWG